MDKTTQDSLAKKPVDMRDRILEHLEALTSAVSLDDLARLSTSDIAETLIISRSLASQYLNDLVRAGLVVKVAGRPVRYFHRRAFQKRFQVKLSASEYASLADLIQATGIADHRDFARAVGFDLSLSSVVEQCKAGVLQISLAGSRSQYHGQDSKYQAYNSVTPAKHQRQRS